MGKEALRILGIDPGTTVTGYGLVEIREKKPVILQMGNITPGKYSDHYQRLKVLHERALHLVREYKPDVLAIEAPFYGKNVQSMLKLGRAQGAAIAAALSRSLPIYEYAPRKIKMSITGQGAASKEQVASMLASILKFKEQKIKLDATDGLAAALCHYFQSGTIKSDKAYSGWKDFMKKNPGRVR